MLVPLSRFSVAAETQGLDPSTPMTPTSSGM
jgi:hypothetical protein